MRIGTIIPVHTFTGQVDATVEWCIQNYPKLFDEFEIVVVADNQIPKVKDLFQRLSSKKQVQTTFSEKRNSLKSSLMKGLSLLRGVDAIHIIEADAIPKFSTFAAMTEAYEHLPNVAGISPMFSWKGSPCYPTHRHWRKDPLFADSFMRVGTVREVGKPGIPFLFSLWNPKALKYLETPGLSEVYGLDGDMGKILNGKYRFFRVTDHDIEHIGGGKNK